MPKPSPRRDGREAAVQYLFGHESLGEAESDKDIFELFWNLRDAKPKVQAFAEELILGVREHQEEIDASISGSLENFRMERLTPVDRNILRLGVYEMRFADYIPPQAAINEAIEIAKRFGTEDSPKFVNGVLDRILKDSDKNDA
ncbi:MAG: transcription antitermination factor NusB [Verrucomicrobiales bacterium]|nr:transcription antitermination factor NusB [Verrucomicrobiales bacterium]